jgi:hypothetical protein
MKQFVITFAVTNYREALVTDVSRTSAKRQVEGLWRRDRKGMCGLPIKATKEMKMRVVTVAPFKGFDR